MAKLPVCPRCGKSDYIKDLGIAMNVERHAHNYRCEGCDRWFQVNVGPEVQGEWLMTFWRQPSGGEKDGEFVALFRTPKGNLYVNQKRTFSLTGKSHYHSGLSRPVIGYRSTSNVLPRYRLTVRTSLGSVLSADTLDMDVWRIDFNPELEREVKANPSMRDTWLRFPRGYTCASLEAKSEPQCKARRDFLQSLINRQAEGAQPEEMPEGENAAGSLMGKLGKWFGLG